MNVLEQMRTLANATVTRKKPSREEDKLQIACRYWFDAQYPQQAMLLHHSPNEGLLPRTARDGAKRKAMGVRAGFPDFILLVARSGYHYLCIELKTAAGRQSDTQKAYEEAVTAVGGKYVICRSLDEFMKVITEYLKAKQNENQ